MPRYVCDFDQVRKVGKEISDSANDLTSSINNYTSNINDNLSSWEGAASTAFSESNDTHVTSSLETAEYINSLGEFIIDAANRIEELENSLASKTI